MAELIIEKNQQPKPLMTLERGEWSNDNPEIQTRFDRIIWHNEDGTTRLVEKLKLQVIKKSGGYHLRIVAIGANAKETSAMPSQQFAKDHAEAFAVHLFNDIRFDTMLTNPLAKIAERIPEETHQNGGDHLVQFMHDKTWERRSQQRASQ